MKQQQQLQRRQRRSSDAAAANGRIRNRSFLLLLSVLLLNASTVLSSSSSAAAPATPTTAAQSASSSSSLFTVLDQSGSDTLRIPPMQVIPNAAIITSPGTKRCFYSPPPPNTVMNSADSTAVLAVDNTNTAQSLWICRGATLKGTSAMERNALATISLMAHVILIDGITTTTTSADDATAAAAAGSGSGSRLSVSGNIGGGDVLDFANSRHARTLTALFRAKLQLSSVSESSSSSSSSASVLSSESSTTTTTEVKEDTDQEKTDQEETSHAPTQTQTQTTPTQTLLLLGVQEALSDDQERLVLTAVQMLFEAVILEKKTTTTQKHPLSQRKGKVSLTDLYQVQIVNISDKQVTQQILEEAIQRAPPVTVPMFTALSNAYKQVLDSQVGSVALDPPFMAHAFVRMSNAHQKCFRTMRARVHAMHSRVRRGLKIVDETDWLEKKLMAAFDSETLSAAGLPLVAPYRQALRRQLQSYVDAARTDLFELQMSHLRNRVLKRFTRQLVQNMNHHRVNEDNTNHNNKDSLLSTSDLNAAALRKEAFYFESMAEELQVPALGLTKQKAVRDMTALLNDALENFPDSPAAKIARSKQTQQRVLSSSSQQSSKKKRGASAAAKWDVGVDLVAVLRPDGFGTLQGFCGYNWNGNSITLGVHNDADDPQVIAQFGGVRPPLLRVQPKLRVDLEL